jgi:hypothetical protein
MYHFMSRDYTFENEFVLNKDRLVCRSEQVHKFCKPVSHNLGKDLKMQFMRLIGLNFFIVEASGSFGIREGTAKFSM